MPQQSGSSVGSGPYLWPWLWFGPSWVELFGSGTASSSDCCSVLILGHKFCSSPSRNVILTLGPPLAAILALDSAWALILSLPHLEQQLRPEPSREL